MSLQNISNTNVNQSVSLNQINSILNLKALKYIFYVHFFKEFLGRLVHGYSNEVSQEIYFIKSHSRIINTTTFYDLGLTKVDFPTVLFYIPVPLSKEINITAITKCSLEHNHPIKLKQLSDFMRQNKQGKQIVPLFLEPQTL